MFSYLIRQSRVLLAFASVISVIYGVCGVLLVTKINDALTEGNRTSSLAWIFAGLAITAMICQALSLALFERLSAQALANLRHYISSRVLATDFRRLEILGNAKVQSALAEHSANVSQFFVRLPEVLTNAVIVAGCMVYMASLSWQIFSAAVAMILFGMLGYHFVHMRAITHLSKASDEQDRLFGYFRSLTDGAKELRLHAGKRQEFDDNVLGKSIESVRRDRTLGMSIFVVLSSWGNFLIYGFIGLVIFVLADGIPNQSQVMTGFALIFIYMIIPMEVLLLSIPRANLARVAARRIESITHEIPANAEATTQTHKVSDFESLVFSDVTHSYYHEQSDEVFELGPIDLEFEPGTVTFLVGGNGSGKTTLAKMIVGLYSPELGQVRLNGELISNENRDHYRQLFSAIFSDFHLFDQLLELEQTGLDEAGNKLLERLHLQHKVRVENGAFSTQALSQGQRKRLALVASYLEDRQFLVFDEWAADQDPVFKDVFYHELLAELKAKGKTILVISHDDKYFDCGDRLLKLENGQLSEMAVSQASSDH